MRIKIKCKDGVYQIYNIKPSNLFMLREKYRENLTVIEERKIPYGSTPP